MGLLERVAEDRGRGAESRIIGGVPWRPWDSPYMRFDAGGPVHPSRAFFGTEKALTLVPVYACVRLIAEYVSSLPLKVYMKDPSGKSRRYDGPSMFDDPAPDTNIMDWLYEALTSLLLQGNAWGYVLSRDGYGYPQQIQWMPPEMVSVIDDDSQPYNPLRTKVYFYGHEVSRNERFHIKAFSLAGRTEGVSPLRAFAMTIANGLEATRYGTDWFTAGGFPPGTFKNNEIEIDATQSAEIRSLLTTSIRRREPLVYGRDWDYHPVTVPPSEAQFIEAMQLNATQLAAVYGLPPDRVAGKRGDSLTYSTVEQGALQIIEALRPWLVRLETAFFRILPQNRYTRFQSDALLKSDLQTRANIYKTWRDIGYMNVDEMREMDDREALPQGVGKDNIPLDAIIGMSRSTRVIPNSLLPQVTPEAELALHWLQELQAGEPAPVPKVPIGGEAPGPGLPKPGSPPAGFLDPLPGQLPALPGPPPAGTPAAGASNPAQAGYGGFIPDSPQEFLAKMVSAVRAQIKVEEEAEAAGPQYAGPWIEPSRNGHGRH